MLFIAVIVIAALFGYFVFYKAGGEWDIIPSPFHYVALPLYCFAAWIIGLFVWEIALFIPRGLSLVMNYIVSLIATLSGRDIYWTIWSIIGDILVIPVIASCIAIPVAIVNFGGDPKTTLIFRYIAWAILTIAWGIAMAIGEMEDIAWYERVIFEVGVVFGYFGLTWTKKITPLF